MADWTLVARLVALVAIVAAPALLAAEPDPHDLDAARVCAPPAAAAAGPAPPICAAEEAHHLEARLGLAHLEETGRARREHRLAVARASNAVRYCYRDAAADPASDLIDETGSCRAFDRAIAFARAHLEGERRLSGAHVERYRRILELATDRRVGCERRVRRARRAVIARRRATVYRRSLAEIEAIPPRRRLGKEQARLDAERRECRARLDARRRARLRAAATRPVAELRAIPEPYRLEAEQRRIERDESRAARRLRHRRTAARGLALVLCDEERSRLRDGCD